MKCSPFAHRTSRRSGFTLVEMLVAASLLGVLGLIGLYVMQSGMMLSSQNSGVNLSAFRGRQTIDWIGEQTRYSLEEPTLITASGTPAAGSTAEGILTKKFVASPYILKEAGGTNADIASTAKQFVVEFRADIPPPQMGDFMLVESVERPELEISNAVSLTTTGSTLRSLVTTFSPLGEVVRPSLYRVSALLYHKEAFVFANYESGTNPRAELRYYRRVRTGPTFTTAGYYEVLGNGFRSLNNQAYFTSTTSNGQPTVILRALGHSTGRAELVERGSSVSNVTTLPIQLRLWALTH